MEIRSLVPDAGVLLAMVPEDLALVVLRCLNTSDENYTRRNQLENIGITNFCVGQAQAYPAHQERIARAISAAFQHLVTTGMLAPNPHRNPYGWFQLTDRARAVRDVADYQRYRHESRYPRGLIHPLIERNTLSEFLKGDYDTAIFKAFKTLENAVRRRGGFDNSAVGVPLMREAFHPTKDTATLTDTSEEISERESLMHLMAGALGRFKNPTSHRFLGLDDPVVAIEILQLASLLLRVAEQRPAASPRGPTEDSTQASRSQ